MKQIFVNLKRFEVSRTKGGLCPQDNPVEWFDGVIKDTIEQGLGNLKGLNLTYLVPESLIPSAQTTLSAYPIEQRTGLAVGCQGVHWQDITPGGNFGAFTSCLPATSAVSLGSEWAIIGHSEERRAKRQIMTAFESKVADDPETGSRANAAIDGLIKDEVQVAFKAGLNVLLCVGESAEERGGGSFEEQQPRIEAVLREQLLTNLEGCNELRGDQEIVIGYEPIWAIGPGKTPPGGEYIAFVSAYIKSVVSEAFGFTIPVVYGGGLKEENAAMIAAISTIDGGLVALTRFTGEIGFDVTGLRGIVEKYLG